MIDTLLAHAAAGGDLSQQQALALAEYDGLEPLCTAAATRRDQHYGPLVTYSPKVFLPLTQLCRDVCHYCTFAKAPRRVTAPYMSIDEVLEQCRQAQAMGCSEALFTLGEKPELRYRAAREALAELGYASTLEYVAAVAAAVLRETSLLPHINAGCMTPEEFALLRPVSASMGMMLESASPRLCEKGGPHYGSPDKQPAVRLQTINAAGAAGVPFTSGILIGIGETRRERIEALLALRDAHQQWGHLQEVIVQNFRAKADTRMSQAPEPELRELLWTLAVARLVLDVDISLQAPPNLSPGVLPQLLAAGINDWGGVSPLTPDYVNPEAPWPQLQQLERETAQADKTLAPRLTVYPHYIREHASWLDPAIYPAVLRSADGEGLLRPQGWSPGQQSPVPPRELEILQGSAAPSSAVREAVAACRAGGELSEDTVATLFRARGADFRHVVAEADAMRRETVGEQVSYTVNRNINYTNVCYFKCQFCAFSKGKQSEDLRGRPYDISAEEIARRCREAWQRGAMEVCMQGGIHPEYTGQTYLDILDTVREATPDMHIHAFSPLEVWQGAETLGISLEQYLRQLRDAGLSTLPGTAAEILDDEVRAVLCPDKINTRQWLEVMETAHRVGLRSTATIMYGHVDGPRNWARHLLRIRTLQQRSGGFTEFVPLPYVHMEAPLYRKGRSRKGPSFREAVLMHAVARLVFYRLIDNIQVSWVKMGVDGVRACLGAGANDLGGTLMNESITRAAGAAHGQEWTPRFMEQQIRALGRKPLLRTTLYTAAPESRRLAALAASPVQPVVNESAGRHARDKQLAPPPVTLIAACN